ncbi:MAG: DUF4406 domain-containing protein [Prevotella sp.]|nr:DUF4406 domain-containing protein [Prevotella sp.]
MKKDKVYISGKISGLERREYLLRFFRAEQILREFCYTTMNPCRFLFCRWPWLFRLLGYKVCLLIDLWILAKCDNIYLIEPDWRESRGVRIERKWAKEMGVQRLPKGIQSLVDRRMKGEASKPANVLIVEPNTRRLCLRRS